MPTPLLDPNQVIDFANTVGAGKFFKVGYFSPLEGGWVEKQMYVGDRQTSFYSIIDGVPVQDSLSFNLIER